MEDQVNLITSEIPEGVEPSYSMNEPNEHLLIHNGEYILQYGSIRSTVKGAVYFNWFPDMGVSINGKVDQSSNSLEIVKAFQSNGTLELIIDNCKFGDCYLSSIVIKGIDEVVFEGEIKLDAFKGDKSIPVNRIKFSIPNLNSFNKDSVKHTVNQKILKSKRRLQLTYDDNIITINSVYNFDELNSKLEKKGGYIILYGGVLENQNRGITLEKADEIFNKLSRFLTFLNGRRVSTFFTQGIHEGKDVWTDFRAFQTDQFKSIQSWAPRNLSDDIYSLWKEFLIVWEDDNEDFIVSALHWYIEANIGSGYTEGAIIMVQTGLELIYNWLIIEKKKMLNGRDSENITASNKIRLVIAQLGISASIPNKFKELKKFSDSDNSIVDAPEAFVQLRNMIVHSQSDKRKKLKSFHPMVRFEALQLGLWYMELALLYIFKYDGKYYNRCSDENFISKKEEYVPWKKAAN